MNFDESKLNHARDILKSVAALCFNDYEPTPAELDSFVEMFKVGAETQRLVEEHLRRAA